MAQPAKSHGNGVAPQLEQFQITEDCDMITPVAPEPLEAVAAHEHSRNERRKGTQKNSSKLDLKMFFQTNKCDNDANSNCNDDDGAMNEAIDANHQNSHERSSQHAVDNLTVGHRNKVDPPRQRRCMDETRT